MTNTVLTYHDIPQVIVQDICQSYIGGKSMYQSGLPHKIPVHTVNKILNKYGVKTRRTVSEYSQFKYNESFFDKIDSEEKAYFLGLLYADGSVSGHDNGVVLALKHGDGEILKVFSKLICNGEDRTREFNIKSQKSYGLSIGFYSKKISDALKALGCMDAKTFKIRLPDLDIEFMRHFFRGYFDGDGCFHFRNGRSEMSEKRGIFKVVSNTSFCQDVASYMKSNHNIHLGVYHPSKNKEVGVYQTGNDETIKFLYRYMYNDATIFMPRKKSIFEEFFLLRCIDPQNESPEIKNRRRPFTEQQRQDRQSAFKTSKSS